MKLRSFSKEPVAKREGIVLGALTAVTAVTIGTLAPSAVADRDTPVPMNAPNANTTMCDIPVSPQGVLATESALDAIGNAAEVRNQDGSLYDGSEKLVPDTARLQIGHVVVTICSANGGIPTFELPDEPR